EDGIRDLIVTGVQTCALPISLPTSSDGKPVHGSSEAIRASPLSITALTPSMVIELSATLVARTSRRSRDGSTARSCCCGGRSPRSEERRVGKEWRRWGGVEEE